MKLPFSQDFEKVLLASLIKYPEKIPDFLDHLSDDLFYIGVHKIIAGSVRHQFKLHKTVDATIVIDHITNIGLKNKDEIDVPSYVTGMVARNAVSPDKIDTYFGGCLKYKYARATISACEDVVKEITSKINGPISDLVAATESKLAKATTCIIEDEYKPVDIYDGLMEYVENIAESGELSGIMTPFKTWNRWWGGLTTGDLTVIAAPPKTGKSTILNYIADVPFCKYNQGKNIKVLILDTELETYRVRTRKLAALAQINESHIKNGNWQKNSDMVRAVQDQLKTIESRKGKVKHIYVANVPIEKIGSIVRRWRATETEPEDECLVIYDYLKITGEKITDANKEYQVLGEKCDFLKKICSETRSAGIAAVQTNSSRDVAMSQRLKWFASSILLFRRFTPEELSEHNGKFGTHCLQPIDDCLRNQGADWENEEWIKTTLPEGTRWEKNWLNLEVKNFNMRERGTRRDMIEDAKKQLDITENEEGRGIREEELL